MKMQTILFWIFLFHCFGDVHQTVVYYSMTNDNKFAGLLPNSGYISVSNSSSNSKTRCGISCIGMTDCVSFFFDTNTSLCQFHDTILQNTTGLAVSPSSLYYKVNFGCEAGWISYQRFCYFFDGVRMLTFDQTKTLCQQKGGTILRMDSEEEGEFLKSLLPTLPHITFGFWIGLTDIQNFGTWVWNETRQAPAYTDWDSGMSQPQLQLEHCALIYLVSYLWHDISCDATLHPACRLEQ